MPSSSWTADRVTTLTTLWRAGRSAAEIAKTLGGVTRNAVIGKAHRLGLAVRMEPSAPRRVRAERPATPRPRRAAPQKPPPPPAAPAVRVRPGARPPIEAIARLFDGAALTARVCRWPVGDPKAEGFGYCGAAVVAKGPYCPGHHAAAYRPWPQEGPGPGKRGRGPARPGGATAR